MNLSHDQKKALHDILEWYEKDKDAMRYVTLGGYAGTGKTTLIALLRKKIHNLSPSIKVGFISYTGKAARVLQNKISEQNAIFADDTIGTIHSLIYSPVINAHEEIVGWKKKEKLDRDLIIVDEASMVDEIIWIHLISYGLPIVVVGDHGQLPPITGNFNLMKKPTLLLNEVHRQAKANPIIDISIQARTRGQIDAKKYSSTVIRYDKYADDTNEAMTELLNNYNQDTLIICGYNKTRMKLNTYIRSILGFDTLEPVSGDRVICLRNNHKEKIYNGMLGTIRRVEKEDELWYRAEIIMDGEMNPYVGKISVKQFNAPTALNFGPQRSSIMQGDLFDYGYALTVHKAQGSQSKRVIVFEERFPKMDEKEWRQWLYTAVTRAEEELYIFPQ